MAYVSLTPAERKWIDNVLAHGGGSFVRSIAEACLRADGENLSILRPSLERFMEKYAKYSLDDWGKEGSVL